MRHTIRTVLICTLLLAHGGCQNPGQSATLSQQQQMINDLDSRAQKLETQMGQVQKDITELKEEFGKLKQAVQKVKPGYIEGSVQEGTH